MTIAIVGLGLIGGSFAKAIKAYTDHIVIGIDRTPEVLSFAKDIDAIDFIGSPQDLAVADMTIMALYPNEIISFVRENISLFKRGSIITDCCGIKRELCNILSPLCEENGLVYISAHPMAGKEVNGFVNSDADLFEGASFILVPVNHAPEAVNTVTKLARRLKFSRVVISTPEEHDKMIAYTSQLPHVLACAYVSNPLCRSHRGFSAGSFRDVSRVANINAELWTQLFFDNKEYLIDGIDDLISNLRLIRDSLSADDKQAVKDILNNSRKIKESVDNEQA